MPDTERQVHLRYGNIEYLKQLYNLGKMRQRGKDLLEGAEERIRALPRKQKLTWVHNRLRDQKGIKEFWSTVPARSDVYAEDLELVDDLV